MTNDTSPCAADLGQRAARLRNHLALPVTEVARRAGVSEQEVELFESTGAGSIFLLLALSRTLSGRDDTERLLATPKFTGLDEVEAYERHRIARK